MKKIILLAIIFFIPSTSYSTSNVENIKIEVNGKNYSIIELYKEIDKIFEKNWGNDYHKRENSYRKLISKTQDLLEKNETEKLKKINLLFNYGLVQTKIKKNMYFSTVHKIKIGESEQGRDIFAYYRGDPRKGFFTIIGSIHGGYEYGTYNTSLFLKDEFIKEGKTGWLIIPTLNPDGLEYYLESDKKYSAYLEGRVNSNNVDLNRNFCTNNFELKEFIKNGYKISTGRNGCNSEKETRVLIDTLKNFKINKVISMHSRGAILFIPDNSFDDKRVINFGNEIVDLLPGYSFNTNYNNDFEKNQKIKEYEINEGGDADFTGTMETYIYEKYNIPTILLELEHHGRIEYRLRGLTKFLEDL